ncbi:STAS domain-containing protein [Mycolicibacillus parakoreensis]|uniref:STAS domain-containing protein n=1 Tax=Mycolicibacillus parakoreensis TaxID=1069221 RepID=A0ABY3U2G5_9MYCO|nr:STAS domain-containing protein [Mycolicibacillus parakoreensis]MCV7313972.1 STAS domain-containing protein [Mycolicibacillus parakoreensis]ULN54158.1 STAS domain-containing protein [Mycolicibacillus parakoreensis]
MTSTSSTRRFTHRYGNPVTDYGDARLRVQSRQLATVVTISGRIDETNIERIRQYAKRYVLAEKPFVLDLSDVTFFSSQGMSLLHCLEETCCTVGVEWCLIAGQPVKDMLRAFGGEAAFPTADSTPEALNQFLDAMHQRRRLLPLLTKTA